MMSKDREGMVSMIIKKIGKPDGSHEELADKAMDDMEPEMEDEEVEGEDIAAEEIWDAIREQDIEAFKEALHSYFELCFHKMEMEPHEEYPHEEE